MSILAGEDSIDGVDSLPVDLKGVVTKTFETGKIVEPPERTIESPKKPKKTRTKRAAVEQETDEKAAKAFEAKSKVEKPEDATPQMLAAIKVADVGYHVEEVAGAPKAASATMRLEEAKGDGAVSTEGIAAPVAKPKAEKSRAKKRSIKKVDTSSEEEPEYIPKKSRSRSTPFKELLA